VIESCWLCVAVSELLSLADGPSRPEHDRGAVRDLVHVGIAAVVHQAAGQVQTQAKGHHWGSGNMVVEGIVAVDDNAVEFSHKAKLHEDSSHRQTLGEREVEEFAE